LLRGAASLDPWLRLSIGSGVDEKAKSVTYVHGGRCDFWPPLCEVCAHSFLSRSVCAESGCQCQAVWQQTDNPREALVFAADLQHRRKETLGNRSRSWWKLSQLRCRLLLRRAAR
jgi:hypothetical protein